MGAIIFMERIYPKSLEEIEALEEDILSPWHVCKYLKTGEQTINCAVKAGLIPWAYLLGSRVVIPKKAFVNYHRYGQVLAGTVKNPLYEKIKIN